MEGFKEGGYVSSQNAGEKHFMFDSSNMKLIHSIQCSTTAKKMDQTCKIDPDSKNVCNKPAIIQCNGLQEFEPKIPPKKIPLKRKSNPNVVKANCSMTFQTALSSAGVDSVGENMDIVVAVCPVEKCGSEKSAPANHVHEYESDDGLCIAAEMLGINSSSVSSFYTVTRRKTEKEDEYKYIIMKCDSCN